MDLTQLSVTELLAAFAEKKTSPAEVTAAYLARIQQVDPQVGAYLFVNENAAPAESAGPLAGVPVGHKDVFNTAGMPTTSASKIIEGYTPPWSAAVVEKLDAAGCVTLGKLNCDEFAMGSSTENSAYQKTRNPWNLNCVPGGSSGGSAAAVAAGLAAFATATDTGGSIRQPAAFCGVVGLKVTYGRVSRYGAHAMASSLDTVGIITKSVPDAALILSQIAGLDDRDATTASQPVPDYSAELKTGVAGKRIGVPKEYFIDGLSAEVRAAVETAIHKLADLGAEIVPISLPHSKYAVPAYYLICPSEVSANLARFDGIRFGPTADADSVEDLVDLYFENRTRGFGDEAKRRIMLGTFALSAGYADAFYKKALKARTLIKQDFDRAFEQVDLIAAPVTPGTAFEFGKNSNDPLQMYLEDIFTIPASLAGVPGISVPCGFDSKNLPIGLQIIGPQWGEAAILAAAGAYESATDWRSRRPNLA